jgi:hypothetical protein
MERVTTIELRGYDPNSNVPTKEVRRVTFTTYEDHLVISMESPDRNPDDLVSLSLEWSDDGWRVTMYDGNVEAHEHRFPDRGCGIAPPPT